MGKINKYFIVAVFKKPSFGLRIALILKYPVKREFQKIYRLQCPVFISSKVKYNI